MNVNAAAATSPVNVQPLLAEEDRARAEFYALLARLWYAAPDHALLAQLASAEELMPAGESSALADAWRGLAAAAGAMDEEAARDEYDAVFVGTGMAEVTPYAAAYRSGAFKDRVLVQLRDELRGLGLARADAVREPEDHFAALCDVMRHLVAQGSDAASLERQKSFFERFVGEVYAPFTQRALASPNTNFYRHVARFTKAFLDIEVESFEML
jgi:TorA maturation chaperone TorD